jgi:hypothetical protein
LVRIPGEGERRFRREGERFSPDPGMAFTIPGMFFKSTTALDIIPAQ